MITILIAILLYNFVVRVSRIEPQKIMLQPVPLAQGRIDSPQARARSPG